MGSVAIHEAHPEVGRRGRGGRGPTPLLPRSPPWCNGMTLACGEVRMLQFEARRVRRASASQAGTGRQAWAGAWQWHTGTHLGGSSISRWLPGSSLGGNKKPRPFGSMRLRILDGLISLGKNSHGKELRAPRYGTTFSTNLRRFTIHIGRNGSLYRQLLFTTP